MGNKEPSSILVESNPTAQPLLLNTQLHDGLCPLQSLWEVGGIHAR